MTPVRGCLILAKRVSRLIYQTLEMVGSINYKISI